MGRGIHRGFITHEELNKSLGKEILERKFSPGIFAYFLMKKFHL